MRFCVARDFNPDFVALYEDNMVSNYSLKFVEGPDIKCGVEVGVVHTWGRMG